MILSLQGYMDQKKNNYLFLTTLSNLFISLGHFCLFTILFLQLILRPQLTMNRNNDVDLYFVIFCWLSFVGNYFYRIYVKHEYMRLKNNSGKTLDGNFYIILNLLVFFGAILAYVNWYVYSENKQYFLYTLTPVLFFLFCFWGIQIISNRYSYERIDFFQTYLSLVFVSFVVLNFLFYKLFKQLSSVDLCSIRDKRETSSIVFVSYKFLCSVPLFYLGVNSMRDFFTVLNNL